MDLVVGVSTHQGNVFQEKVIASGYVLNGLGKSTGLVQLNELGRLESSIMLTNTVAIPGVTQGVLAYLMDQNKEIGTG